MHQDNFYQNVEPGPCMLHGRLLIESIQKSGNLLVAPKTNHDEIYCPELADPKGSFTKYYLKIQESAKTASVIMDQGDVLFFNGNLIHGFYRNKTMDGFRKSFIFHYAGDSTTNIGPFIARCSGKMEAMLN